MTLSHRIHPGSGSATVTLTGRIDRDAEDALDAAYAEAVAAEPAVVVLDLTDVDYINSSGIALIVGLLGAAQSEGRTLQATGLSEHYRHIFEITRLSEFIHVVPAPDGR